MDKERMFLHRDESAERNFISDYQTSLNRANKWIIPIMKKCGIPITKDDVIQFSVALDLRKAIADYLTRKSLEGTEADLIKAMDIHKSEETRYDEKIKELINEKAENKIQIDTERIRSKKDSDSDFFIRAGVKIRKFLSKDEILSTFPEKKSIYVKDLENEYQDISVTAEQNLYLHILQCKLAQVRDLLIMDGEALKFNGDAIREKCNVYADGKNEIQLVEKLQQLANLINEIYGNNFCNPGFAFNIFFKQTKDGVKINPDIEKKRIIEYSKNFKTK
jgi:hypothetical protein